MKLSLNQNKQWFCILHLSVLAYRLDLLEKLKLVYLSDENPKAVIKFINTEQERQKDL